MKIGGLNTFSLSDFPGKVAVVVFTQGCNFRCPYCHNGSLIPCNVPRNLTIPQEDVLEFLRNRVGKLDAVVVSGGEPVMLQMDLCKFLRRTKDMGFTVKLDTNGSKPQVLQEILRKCLVDYVAMDVKAPLNRYNKLTGIRFTPADKKKIKDSIVLISESGVKHEFRTTIVEQLLTSEDLQTILRLIPALTSTLGHPVNIAGRRVSVAQRPFSAKHSAPAGHPAIQNAAHTSFLSVQ